MKLSSEITKELKKSVEILGGYSGTPMTGSPILQEVKKMNTLLSSNGGGNGGIETSLVQEVILDTDATSIVFDGLDAIVDGGYELTLESGIGLANTPIQMFFNDDLIATNYSRIMVSSNAALSTPQVVISDNAVFCATSVGSNMFIRADISPIGYIKSFMVRGDVYGQENYISKKTLLNNVNKIEIKSDIANAIPAGTKASLYRRKHDISSGTSYDPEKDNEQDTRLNNIESEQITQNTNITELQNRPIADVSKAYVDSADINLQAQIDALGTQEPFMKPSALGDLILQNSEWTSDFVIVDEMTFVKCNRTVVEGSAYPFIADCNLAVSVSSAKKPINMTSATTPAPYVVTSSSNQTYSNSANWKAFDGIVNANGWMSEDVAQVNPDEWIAIDLGNATTVTGYDINVYNSGYTGSGHNPKNWNFQGSDDGTNWTTVHSRTGEDTYYSGETRHYDLSTPATFRRFRLIVDVADAVEELYIGELSLWVTGTFLTPTLYITDPETTQNIYYYMRIK